MRHVRILELPVAVQELLLRIGFQGDTERNRAIVADTLMELFAMRGVR